MKKHRLNRLSIVSIVVAAFVVLLAQSCAKKSNEATTDSTKTASAGGGASAERGKYLVTTTGCNDCHTPWKMGPQGPEPDMSRMLSGHPAAMKIDKPAQTAP